jgi:hypothetical protein
MMTNPAYRIWTPSRSGSTTMGIIIIRMNSNNSYNNNNSHDNNNMHNSNNSSSNNNNRNNGFKRSTPGCPWISSGNCFKCFNCFKCSLIGHRRIPHPRRTRRRSTHPIPSRTTNSSSNTSNTRILLQHSPLKFLSILLHMMLRIFNSFSVAYRHLYCSLTRPLLHLLYRLLLCRLASLTVAKTLRDFLLPRPSSRTIRRQLF